MVFREDKNSGWQRTAHNVNKEDHMSNFVKGIKAFWQEEDGVTAIEYGLIAALIAVVLIAGATLVGTSLNGKFTTISGAVDAAGQ